MVVEVAAEVAEVVAEAVEAEVAAEAVVVVEAEVEAAEEVEVAAGPLWMYAQIRVRRHVSPGCNRTA